MSDFLATMARASQLRVDELLESKSALDSMDAPPIFLTGGFDLIAELKPESPSEGPLATGLDLDAQCDAYARGGAAAVSVLTEPDRFGGSIELLARVARRLRPHGIPVMRKDFLVHPIQIDEAASAGAGGVLLILAMLEPKRLVQMVERALELRLFVLLEAFDAAELHRAGALAVGREDRVLVGLNCRDLTTLCVEPERFGALASVLPRGPICVAESGLMVPLDAARVAQQGYRMALVGSALMRAEDPAVFIQSIISAGRAAAGLPRVKICGLQTTEAVTAAVQAGADAVGFVMVDSPRRVDPERARVLAEAVPDGVATMGVFRVLDAAAVETASRAGLGWVQGHPTPEGLALAAATGLRTLSALNDGPELPLQLSDLNGPVLVDGPRSGSGEVADLDRVAGLARKRPLVLAGGLCPESVEAVIARVRPAGVDVSSGVERCRGVKDLDRIKNFVRIARSALDEAAQAAGGER